MILFPPTLMYTDCEGKTEDLVQSFINEEFIPFPVAVHDDMLDGLARIKDMRIEFPKEQESDYSVPERSHFDY